MWIVISIMPTNPFAQIQMQAADEVPSFPQTEVEKYVPS